MAITTVTNFDTARIPTEGSPTFREDASYVWATIPTVIDSMNSAIEGQNATSDDITTKYNQIAVYVVEVSDNATIAQNAADAAIAAKDAAESAVSTLPEGTISDTTIATNKAWSSSKINDEIQAITYGQVTTTTDGLMIADDKSKLDGIADEANNYTLPTDVVHTSGATFTGLVAYDDTSTTGTIDCSLGNSFSHSVTADTTYSFTNVPASGNACIVTLKLNDAGSYTLTFPSSVKWSGGTAPTFTASGDDAVVFYTIDGGTTWYANANVGYA